MLALQNAYTSFRFLFSPPPVSVSPPSAQPGSSHRLKTIRLTFLSFRLSCSHVTLTYLLFKSNGRGSAFGMKLVA